MIEVTFSDKKFDFLIIFNFKNIETFNKKKWMKISKCLSHFLFKNSGLDDF